MRFRGALAIAAGCLATAGSDGCAKSNDASFGDGSGGASSGAGCTACVKDAECGAGSRCGQFQGDSFCAPDCTDPKSAPCAADRACTAVNTAEGQQASVCVPTVNRCGTGTTSGSGMGGTTTVATASSGTGNPEVCGSLLGPDVKACCTSCTKSGKTCQANGCYGGWWCNKDSCACQAAPAPASCGSSASSGASSSSSSGSGGAGGGGPSGIGPTGGKLDKLTFAIVGDTRPPVENDLAGYPTAIITKIWQDVASQGVALAVSTGDYMFAKPYGNNQSAQQLDLYLKARANFVNQVFPALGNHECTGGVTSNCGTGNVDGLTNNYVDFLNKMLKGISSTPYYSIEIDDKNGKWTSKFVFIAANAWDSNQASWLDATLAKSTTYTFVIRHEATVANQAPGVTPSDAIVAKHPYTVMICGHTHTFEWKPYNRQLVVGNGGAPLTGAVNYGYVIAAQRPDGAMEFHEYDYATNALNYSFALHADGTPSK